jgi:hypothetical protein
LTNSSIIAVASSNGPEPSYKDIRTIRCLQRDNWDYRSVPSGPESFRETVRPVGDISIQCCYQTHLRFS